MRAKIRADVIASELATTGWWPRCCWSGVGSTCSFSKPKV
jgi:hypothetical protein